MYIEELYHIGVDKEHTSVPGGPGSGRYAPGSGENPDQVKPGSQKWLDKYRELEASGMSQDEIREALGHRSLKDMKAYKSNATQAERARNMRAAKAMYDQGMTLDAIGKALGGRNESVIRNWLKNYDESKLLRNQGTADMLKARVDSGMIVDVGKGSEILLNIHEPQLDSAVRMLVAEGYTTHELRIPNATNPTENKTTTKVLAPPGMTIQECYNNLDKVSGVIDMTTDDGGKSWRGMQYPASIDASRVKIRYNEEGGLAKDGVMELRPGVADLSLGNSHYAQVRIAVNDSHYLKGMAVYGDPKDFPPGVDIIFNTNKHEGTPMLGTGDNTVLKTFKKDKITGEIDRKNPFGAAIKAFGQSEYEDADGNKHLSAINKVNEENDWGRWSKTLSSQFLSKQGYPLLQRQLDLTVAAQQSEFEDIKAIQIPALKKYYLEKFASDCDAKAVELKATGFKGQAAHVIIPVESMKDNEIYDPLLKDGTTVALIRYPHQGQFEIPILKVNNKNAEARKVLGTTPADAVGINHNVAEILSGADFDGDTVTVIPFSKNVKIANMKPLEELKGFDPKEEYRAYEGMPRTGPENGFRKGFQMGVTTNLLNDMTLKGAPMNEIAMATKHAQVVIDAEKHNLDWRRSEQDNHIAELKKRWQDGGGAGTVISRAKSPAEYDHVLKDIRGIQLRNTDPKTGEKLVVYDTPEFYKDKNGKEQERKTKTTKMAKTNDARTLLSKDPNVKELAYANFANQMKALANEARKEYLATPSMKVDPSAKETYAREVSSLKAKLNEAKKNAPRERIAQIKASIQIKDRTEGLDLDKDQKKKIRSQEIAIARFNVGAKSRKDRNFEITEREWKAIEAGAVNSTKLNDILSNTDPDALRVKALGAYKVEMSDAKIAWAKRLKASDYTQAEIAEVMGVSASTVSKMLNPKKG